MKTELEEKQSELISILHEIVIKHGGWVDDYSSYREIKREIELLEQEPPVEQPISAEEILQKHIKGSQWYATVCDERILAAMHEYASQFKTPDKPSDTIRCKGCGNVIDTNYCQHCNELWAS
jgi:hypothetical protein